MHHIIFIAAMLIVGSTHASAHSDSIKVVWPMDTCVHPNDQRIGFVPQSKIKYAETRKPNYVLPIIGGAVLGIGLALWLRRKK